MAKKLEDHLKEKGFYFCAVCHDLKMADSIIETLPDFSYWAYIYHEPDDDDGNPHYHFLLHHNGSRSVKQIADKLNYNGQYIQVCRKVVAFRRYMLHLDSPDKKKYTLDDIKTNSLPSFKSAIIGNENRDVNSLFSDYKKLLEGRISPDEFIQLNYVELQKMNAYQKLKSFELILKGAHYAT